MTIKQISVFLENHPGKLAEFTKLLSSESIDLRAITIAESSDFGIVRIVVGDVYNATTILKNNDYICSLTDVLAVEVKDQAGALADVITILGENDVNVEYMYEINSREAGVAYMVIRVNDNAKARAILEKNGMRIIGQEEL